MAQLIIPPWLRPAEPAERSYEAGAQLGQQMAERERANALAQREEMRREQEALINQQYNEQTMRLNQQEEQRKQQEFQLKATDAARTFAAQQQYQQAVAGGMDASKALLQFGPQFGLPLSGLTNALRQTQPFTPGPTIRQGDYDLINTAPNRYTPKAVAPQGSEQASVSGLPVMVNGEAVEGAYAVPAPSGRGYTVHNVPGYAQQGRPNTALLRIFDEDRKNLEKWRADPASPAYRDIENAILREKPGLKDPKKVEDLSVEVDGRFKQMISDLDRDMKNLATGGRPATNAPAPVAAPAEAPAPRKGNIKGVTSVRPVATGGARPAVNLPSGAVATVRSISVGDERGEWVIPTIVDGKPVDNETAIQLWRTGKNAAIGGPFKSVKEADDFSEQFHQQEARRLGLSGKATAPDMGVIPTLALKLRIGTAELMNALEQRARELRTTIDDPAFQERLKKIAGKAEDAIYDWWMDGVPINEPNARYTPDK